MAFCLVFASHNRPVSITEEQSPSISQSERALQTQIIFFFFIFILYIIILRIARHIICYFLLAARNL